MNKKLIKILIIIWSVIAIGVAGLLVYGISNGTRINGMFKPFVISRNSTLKVQKEESIEINNLDKLNIDFSSSDIVLESTDEPNIKVIQKSSGNLDDDQKFIVNKSDNEVTIEKNDFKRIFKFFNFGFVNERIEVYIPKSYNRDLQVDLSSGDVKYNLDGTLNNLSCKASSGDIVIAENAKVNVAELKVSSGEIEVGSLVSKKYKVDSSSGDISIASITGSGDIKASSGEIKVRYKDVDEYSRVDANSGDIRIEIPKELNLEFNGECTSGDIKANFDLNYKNEEGDKATAKIGNAPYKKLDARTSSGEMKIVK